MSDEKPPTRHTGILSAVVSTLLNLTAASFFGLGLTEVGVPAALAAAAGFGFLLLLGVLTAAAGAFLAVKTALHTLITSLASLLAVPVLSRIGARRQK